MTVVIADRPDESVNKQPMHCVLTDAANSGCHIASQSFRAVPPCARGNDQTRMPAHQTIKHLGGIPHSIYINCTLDNSFFSKALRSRRHRQPRRSGWIRTIEKRRRNEKKTTPKKEKKNCRCPLSKACTRFLKQYSCMEPYTVVLIATKMAN